MKKQEMIDLITWYCKEKNEILYKETGMNIFNDLDYEEIKNWSDSQLEQITNDMDSEGDLNCCPWCILFFHANNYSRKYCPNCSYQKNHEDISCFCDFSNYQEIINKTEYKQGFTNIEEIVDLVEEFIDKVEKMKGE